MINAENAGLLSEGPRDGLFANADAGIMPYEFPFMHARITLEGFVWLIPSLENGLYDRIGNARQRKPRAIEYMETRVEVCNLVLYMDP